MNIRKQISTAVALVMLLSYEPAYASDATYSFRIISPIARPVVSYDEVLEAGMSDILLSGIAAWLDLYIYEIEEGHATEASSRALRMFQCIDNVDFLRFAAAGSGKDSNEVYFLFGYKGNQYHYGSVMCFEYDISENMLWGNVYDEDFLDVRFDLTMTNLERMCNSEPSARLFPELTLSDDEELMEQLIDVMVDFIESYHQLN